MKLKTKQGVDRKPSSERSCRIRRSSDVRKNRSRSNYQCHFSLFAGFKRESTQGSDQYNLAIWAVNLFDGLV